MASFEDLALPRLAERMTKSITGVGLESGPVLVSERMMDEYALKEADYERAVANQAVYGLIKLPPALVDQRREPLHLFVCTEPFRLRPATSRAAQTPSVASHARVGPPQLAL